MSIESKEFEQNQITITTLLYRTKNDALSIYNNISLEDRVGMADVYQKAFGESPWFEKNYCPKCQTYLRENVCPNCSMSDLPEAYPKDQLLSSDFPSMMGSFTPGTLLLAYYENKIIGFCTGGFISLEKLIEKKYNNNQQILQSIEEGCVIKPTTNVFYDNETCILPGLQKTGIGKQFSQTRINIAKTLGAEYICGRTINLPWLQLKEKQFGLTGYNFQAFTPVGDTYESDGINRRFYLASTGIRRK